MQNVTSIEGVVVFTKYIIKYKPNADGTAVSFWDTLNNIHTFKGTVKEFLMNF